MRKQITSCLKEVIENCKVLRSVQSLVISNDFIPEAKYFAGCAKSELCPFSFPSSQMPYFLSCLASEAAKMKSPLAISLSYLQNDLYSLALNRG